MRSNKPAPRFRRSLFYSTALLGGTLLLAAEAGAQTLPTGPAFPAGQTNPGINTVGDQMTVSLNQNRTIINWTSFNIGTPTSSTETVDFKNGTTSPLNAVAVLNRDLSGNPSSIYGTLKSDPNISVYLINTNGILFGSSANVSVGSLVASALDLTDNDFQGLDGSPGTFQFTTGLQNGIVIDPATTNFLAAQNLVLIGASVGVGAGSSLSATAGDVAIVAGTDITMSAPGSPLSFTINQGTPIANAVMVDATISGQNVTLAAARQGAVVDTLLSVSGSMIATGAAATDRGIVLVAGQSGPGVTVTSTSTSHIDAGGASFDSNTDATFVTAGDLDIGSASVDRDYSVTAANFLGNSLAPTLNGAGSDFTITDTAGGLTVGALTAPGTLSITTQNGGVLTANGNLVSTNEGITLNGSGGISLNGIALSSAGSQSLTGVTTVSGSTSATATGAGSTITFNSTVDGGGALTTSSLGGTLFNANVGATTPLASLAVTGPATIQGNVSAAGAVTFSGTLSLGGAGVRKISGGSASFQAVDSAVAGVTGLSVDTGVGAATFNSPVGAGGALSGLAVRAGSATFTGTNFVGTLAADVTAGGVAFTNGAALTVGTVDGLGGVTADAGPVGIVTTGPTSDLAVAGPVTATAGTVTLTSSRNLTGGGAISAGGVGNDATLSAAAGSINLSGTVNAGGDVSADALTAVSLTGLVTAGIDIAINSGGTVGTGALTAQDDIVLRSAGAAATGALTSGAGADASGAGDTLAGATLAGNDIDAVANGLRVGAVRANGAGSDIRLAGGAGGIGDGAQDLDLIAGGDIALASAARGLDVALKAGGTIQAGAISARDDIAARATGAAVFGALTSGTTVDSLPPADTPATGAADTLLATALVGNDIDIAANGLVVGAARANGAGSDIRLDGGAGGIGSGSQDLDLRTGGDIVLTGAATGRDVALGAGGTISAGAITAHDDIAARSVGSASFGALTSGTAPATDTSLSGAADSLLGVLLAGNDIDLGSGDDLSAGQINSADDATLAAVDLLTLAAPAIVAQDLTMTAAQWGGSALSSVPGDDLSITDTAGGLTLTTPLTVPGLLTVTVQNGGALTVNGALASVNEDIALATTGGGNMALAANLTTGTGAGRSVTLTSSGTITQAGGAAITSHTLAGSSAGTTTLNGSNAITDLAAFTVSSGSFSLNDVAGTAMTGLNVVGAVSAPGGVTIATQGGDLNVASTGSVGSGAGTIDLYANANVAVNGAVASTGGGSILIEADTGQLSLAANVTTSGDVDLDAGTTITQTAGMLAANRLTGRSVGATSLGSTTNAVSYLGGFTADGLTLRDVGGIIVDGVVDGGSGGVLIDTSGTLAVDVAGVVKATNATIDLRATGAGSDIMLDGPVNAGTGQVILAAGRDIGQGNVGIVTAGTLTGSSGGDTDLATLTNQITNLGPFNAASFALLDAGGLTVTGAVTAPGGASLETSGNLLLNAPVNAGAGTATLKATGAGSTIGQSAAGVITAGSLTGSSNGSTTLTAALNAVADLGAFTSNGFAFRNDPALTVSGPVNSGPGALSIEVVGDPVTINGNISGQGVSVKATGVAQAASSTVNAGAGTIRIDADDGSVNLAGSLVTTNGGANAVAIVDSTNAVIGNIATGAGGTLTLGGAGADLLNGNVTQTPGTSIVAGTLTGNAAGAVTLANAGNQIDFLTAFTSNGFALRDGTGGLTVNGPVNAGAGNLSLRVDSGNLILAGNLAAGGTVALDALAGSISQSGGQIAAGTLTGSSSGSTSLNSATNAISNLAAFTAGTDFSLVDSIALTVTGPVTATTGDLSITAPGIAFAGQTLTAGDDVALNAQGGVLAGGTVVAGDDFNGTGAMVAVASASAVDIALRATGGALNAGTLTARDDIALRATGAIAVIAATSGATVGSQGPTDTPGAADALIGALAGNDINAAGDSIAFGTATATGPSSDLNLSAQTGALMLGTGNSGSTATLTKSGSTGELQVVNGLTTGNSSANGHAAISSTTNARLASVESLTGNVAVIAAGDATGGTLRAAGNTSVAAGPLAQFTVAAAGGNAGINAGSVLVGTATATNGSLALTASSGQLTLGTGSAGTTATLIKVGATGELQVTSSLTSGTAAANGDATVSTSTHARLGTVDSRTGSVLVTALNGSVTGAPLGTPVNDGRPAPGFGGANLLAATAGRDVTVRAGGAEAQLSTVTAGRTARIEANDLGLLAAVTAPVVEIVNRGASGATRLGDGLAAAAGLNLGQAEVDRIATPSLTIDSAARNVEIGNLAVAPAAGSAQLILLGTARFDVTGQMSTAQASTGRMVQIGGSAANSGEASVIRVAATPGAGGRLLMGNSQLQLRGQKIGVGQDADFLAALGLVPGGTPASQATVNADYIGNAGSRLYNPAQPYSNNTILTAHQLTVTYTDYALFQNTALPGLIPQGSVVGSLGVQQTLALNSSGASAPNGFALFGEVSGRQGVEAALLGPNFIALNGANPNNTRINGCLVGSGAGGCLISAFSTPPVSIFGDSQAAILSAEGDLPLTFDPVVGANNEALFSGLSSGDSTPSEPICEPGPDTPDCPDEKEDPR